MMRLRFKRGSGGSMNEVTVFDPAFRRSGKRIFWSWHVGSGSKVWFGPAWRFWRGECPSLHWGRHYVALLVHVAPHWSVANCIGCGPLHARYSERIEYGIHKADSNFLDIFRRVS